MQNNPSFTLDALLPADMAVKAEEIGVAKANMGSRRLLVLGVLAGAFIALGAVFATTAAVGAAALPYGVGRVLVGLVFSLGLILVIVGGAELFTGNNLIVMAWASRRITTRALLRNWLFVYLGNFIGAFGTAGLVFFSGQFKQAGGALGLTMLTIAMGKLALPWHEVLVLGILCNALVCLAVWLTMSARTTTDRILAILFPITAFVAAGFEHSVANMYFIPIALLVRAGAPADFWSAIDAAPADFAILTWHAFLFDNLIPVTFGNIIGGTLLVGAVYWALYLRQPKKLR
jgi:formate transporter FocA